MGAEKRELLGACVIPATSMVYAERMQTSDEVKWRVSGRYVERIDSAVEAGVPGPGMKWRQAEYGPGIEWMYGPGMSGATLPTGEEPIGELEVL